MAKHVGEYNGTGFTQSKKLYDYNGTSSTQIKKAYDYNGTSSTQVYSADVTLTNVIGANSDYALSLTRAIDAGWTDSYEDKWYRRATNDSAVRTFTLTSGHRYYVRADCSKFGEFLSGGANQVYFSDSSRHKIAENGTGHAIIAVNQASCKPEQYTTGRTGVGYSAGTTSNFYMIVDITALEQMTGTLTADQVWNYFGSAVFYGSKTIAL